MICHLTIQGLLLRNSKKKSGYPDVQLSGRSCLECEMIKQVRKSERQICIKGKMAKRKSSRSQYQGWPHKTSIGA